MEGSLIIPYKKEKFVFFLIYTKKGKLIMVLMGICVLSSAYVCN